MKYPMTKNWLTYRRVSKTEYEVLDNLEGEEYIMGATAALFAKGLDGRTDPYEIDPSFSEEHVDALLMKLRELDLLRTSRVLSGAGGTLLYTLWIPRWTKGLRVFARVMNSILLVLWLPVLIAGFRVFLQNLYRVDLDFSTGAYLLSLLVGVCMHEYAHAFAGISYRAKVFEFGIGFQNFLPCAYTMLDSTHCKRLHRIQINGAGIEMNLFLTGVSLLLCPAFPACSDWFFSAALCNGCLSAVNLLCLEGLDGMAILSDLVGLDVSALMKNAKQVVRSGKRRKALRRKGASGYGLILMSYILVVSQASYLFLLLLNIGGILGWFQ